MGVAADREQIGQGVDALAFREAMSRLGAAVHVITTAGPAGRCGITASAVCSVSDSPPTVLVCLHRKSQTNAILKENGVFCVNTLAADHSPLSDIFAGLTGVSMEERIGAADWMTLATGAPALVGALVSVDCRITEVNEVGTHSVLFGEVQGLHFGERRPALVYLHREYKSL